MTNTVAAIYRDILGLAPVYVEPQLGKLYSEISFLFVFFFNSKFLFREIQKKILDEFLINLIDFENVFNHLDRYF